MAPRRRKTPDLFEDHFPDPVEAATGGRAAASELRLQEERGHSGAGDGKRKAGFYLSEETLARFNTCYYRLKLAGAAVDNKSALLEAALAFALDDLDRGADSRILKQHIKPGIRRR